MSYNVAGGGSLYAAGRLWVTILSTSKKSPWPHWHSLFYETTKTDKYIQGEAELGLYIFGEAYQSYKKEKLYDKPDQELCLTWNK